MISKDFFNVDAFITAKLPQLLMGKTKLHAHMATYKDFAVTTEEQELAAKKSGLTLSVTSGHMEPYEISLIAQVWSLDPEIRSPGIKTMFEMSQGAQAIVSEKIFSDLAQKDRPLMVVIYGGLTAFNEAVAMAKDVKNKIPQAQVVITTCDCNPTMKAMVLEPLLKDGTLVAVVETRQCGGLSLMRTIMHSIIDQFPAKEINQSNSDG